MFNVSFEFTKYIGAEIEEREVMGKMQKCISIPIEINGLSITPYNRVYGDFKMIEMRPNKNNCTYYLSAMIKDKNIIKDVKMLGFERNFQFIGYAKISNNRRQQICKRNTTPLDEAMDR